MSKAVLISIRPKWCAKIIIGRKTMELRKSVPKLETPFKCYIYCTMPETRDPHNILELHGVDGKIRKANGKVIGEFVCDYILQRCEMANADIAEQQSCVRREDIYFKYSEEGKHYIYGWHISSLRIYDEARELTEFRRSCPNDLYCESCAMYWENNGTCGNESLQIRRPPQSWCYVEAMKDAK